MMPTLDWAHTQNYICVCHKHLSITKNREFMTPTLSSLVAPLFALTGELWGIYYECHYSDVIMSALASQITSLAIVYSGADQRKTPKLRVTALCARNSPVTGGSPHKRPVTRKMFPFHDVIMDRRTSVRLLETVRHDFTDHMRRRKRVGTGIKNVTTYKTWQYIPELDIKLFILQDHGPTSHTLNFIKCFILFG